MGTTALPAVSTPITGHRTWPHVTEHTPTDTTKHSQPTTTATPLGKPERDYAARKRPFAVAIASTWLSPSTMNAPGLESETGKGR